MLRVRKKISHSKDQIREEVGAEFDESDDEVEEDMDVVMRTTDGHLFHLDFYNDDTGLYEGWIEASDITEARDAQYSLDHLIP